MYKSHKLQGLLNYFDENDVRVRENSVAIDGQLLNVAAQQLDDIEQRLNREIGSTTLATAPARIDNLGVYMMARFPVNYAVPNKDADLTVEGQIGNTWTTLRPFDDRLPVPASIYVDPGINPVPLTDPVILDISGNGNSTSQIYFTQQSTPGALPIPNRVTFYAENFQQLVGPVDITITGQTYPASPWQDETTIYTEYILRFNDGVFQSNKVWQRIDSIVVRNLPIPSRLRAWSMPFNMPLEKDDARPFTMSDFRDREFDRYWLLDSSNDMLYEQFIMNSFAGLSYIQSYSGASNIKALAVEPNTWGMFLASDNSIYYVDRRELLPDSLSVSAITREPIYGISVEIDQSKLGRNRYLLITPFPYAKAPEILIYRYSVIDPTGARYVIQQDSSLEAYTVDGGWATGVPKPVTISLDKIGTYVLTMECMDTAGNIVPDSVPYANLAINVLATLSLPPSIISPKGLAFDYLERLWIWTGNYAIPVKVSYNAFLVDRASNAVFITDPFQAVRFS